MGRPNTPARRFSAPEEQTREEKKGKRTEVSWSKERKRDATRERRKERTKSSHLVSTLERCASDVGKDGASMERGNTKVSRMMKKGERERKVEVRTNLGSRTRG